MIFQILSKAARQAGASDLSQRALAGQRGVRLTTQEIRQLIGVMLSTGRMQKEQPRARVWHAVGMCGRHHSCLSGNNSLVQSSCGENRGEGSKESPGLRDLTLSPPLGLHFLQLTALDLSSRRGQKPVPPPDPSPVSTAAYFSTQEKLSRCIKNASWHRRAPFEG